MVSQNDCGTFSIYLSKSENRFSSIHFMDQETKSQLWLAISKYKVGRERSLSIFYIQSLCYENFWMNIWMNSSLCHYLETWWLNWFCLTYTENVTRRKRNNSPPRYRHKETESQDLNRYFYTNIHWSIIHKSQNVKQPKYPPRDEWIYLNVAYKYDGI